MLGIYVAKLFATGYFTYPTSINTEPSSNIVLAVTSAYHPFNNRSIAFI